MNDQTPTPEYVPPPRNSAAGMIVALLAGMLLLLVLCGGGLAMFGFLAYSSVQVNPPVAAPAPMQQVQPVEPAAAPEAAPEQTTPEAP